MRCERYVRENELIYDMSDDTNERRINIWLELTLL